MSPTPFPFTLSAAVLELMARSDGRGRSRWRTSRLVRRRYLRLTSRDGGSDEDNAELSLRTATSAEKAGAIVAAWSARAPYRRVLTAPALHLCYAATSASLGGTVVTASSRPPMDHW